MLQCARALVLSCSLLLPKLCLSVRFFQMRLTVGSMHCFVCALWILYSCCLRPTISAASICTSEELVTATNLTHVLA